MRESEPNLMPRFEPRHTTSIFAPIQSKIETAEVLPNRPLKEVRKGRAKSMGKLRRTHNRSFEWRA